MAFFGSLRESFYATFGCCLPTSLIRINGRTLKVVKLLGEGGFSLVYLVEDPVTQRLFAVKKVHCADNAIGNGDGGQDAVRQAVQEAEMTRLFDHPNIIKVLDVCVAQDSGGRGKTVYIFLPYYKRGTLQDILSDKQKEGNYFPERQILRIFRNVCLAVQQLHCYELPEVPARRQDNQPASTDAYGRSSYDGGDMDDGNDEARQAAERRVVYAHRDIKLGNVLMADDNVTPVLMDFGSMARARVTIRTRQQALQEQDRAAEQCSMAYRAPELFDVKTGTTLDEKVDIWSLGCLLYAIAYGESPFEAAVNEAGGSVALAVQSGKFQFPSSPSYSDEFKQLVKGLLVTDPKQRPDITQTISMVEAHMEQLGA
ncbi:kinase-like domain-containing protein [Syncephalis pseudoplumigaleata]|uniref:non-specific serine/threonine protein kinase n=1 Tax=Syncephalis pseudoplumigaleata TaxID=1712513 RepID=A0A4P9Z4C0_9FUNG|nr:kinase-like domain-containing protein [Syncephalis pseudoplumigaleata]|eukprot:RKP27346.1 kinase-like domain-containing protein [Syncephalis pseudoplumigaleata]